MSQDRSDRPHLRRGSDESAEPQFEDGQTVVDFALDNKTVGGRFQLGERLSWGAMGTVYRALDLMTNKEVAVKVPHLVDEVTDRRFKNESEVVKSMVCTSIIGYVAHGSNEEPFLAMELVSGEPLWKTIQRAPLDEHATLMIARRVAAALAAIHIGGLIHRDIKPGNIVIGFDGAVKLLDFGLSRNVTGEGVGTMEGQLIGTLGYMAPEQFGGKVVDPRTDVYSVGVVLFECLTARRAFNRQLKDLAVGRVEADLETRTLPAKRGLIELIEACTAKQAAGRPKDGLDLLVRCIRLEDPSFVLPPSQDVSPALLSLFREGRAEVTDTTCHRASMIGEVVARLFGEIVAPSLVVRVRCDPAPDAEPMAMMRALKLLLDEEKIPHNLGKATAPRGPTRPLVLVLEDVGWCDPESLAELEALSKARSLFLVTTRSKHVDDHQAIRGLLNPMSTWCLRAAGMFGRSFPADGVKELIAGAERKQVGPMLQELARMGLVRLTKSAKEESTFASGDALELARAIARPHETRIGRELARVYPRVREPEERLNPEIVTSPASTCPELQTAMLHSSLQ